MFPEWEKAVVKECQVQHGTGAVNVTIVFNVPILVQ
jgi:hypothetical protein